MMTVLKRDVAAPSRPVTVNGWLCGWEVELSRTRTNKQMTLCEVDSDKPSDKEGVTYRDVTIGEWSEVWSRH